MNVHEREQKEDIKAKYIIHDVEILDCLFGFACFI